MSPMSRNEENGDTSININENTKQMFVVNDKKIILNGYIQEDDPNIEINFRQALDRGNNLKIDLKQTQLNETFSNITEMNNNGTAGKDEVTTQDATSLLNVTENMTTELYTTTEIPGFYPNPRYNNTNINSLAITEKNPDSTLNPPLTEEQHQNFTMNTTNSIMKTNKTEEGLIDITDYPIENTPDRQIKGVYKDALYNNAEIDQLSITTNFYTNELPPSVLPPPRDDRWTNFSSSKKMLPPLNEFKPLAGLYYDGFLHKPVTKSSGFVPYNNYYHYY